MRALFRNLALATAALVAAVGLYVVFTRPARAIQFDAAIPDDVVFGAYHIHTSRSDGSGSVADVAAAARRAGLKFVILTDHGDVMLEAATTSFQVHLKTPARLAHRYFNASLIASGPVMAVSANAPFLFGKALWDETRIPLFEQAVDIDGARSKNHRVTFGNDYLKSSIFEVVEENREHYAALLPILFDEKPEALRHLRLHNGTIWRWNRRNHLRCCTTGQRLDSWNRSARLACTPATDSTCISRRTRQPPSRSAKGTASQSCWSYSPARCRR